MLIWTGGNIAFLSNLYMPARLNTGRFQTFRNARPLFPVKVIPALAAKRSHPYPETCAVTRIHSVSGDLTQGRRSAKISKISESAHPSSPWTTPDIQATTNNSLSLDINIFDIGYLHFKHLDIGKNQLQTSTTRQQHQISISFQFPPPGSSTHQPASSKTTSQPAVNSTTLPHPHHGSQVCCCIDIL